VVCALVTTVSPAKTTEPFDAVGGPKEPCIQWIYIRASAGLNDMKNGGNASVATISETTCLARSAKLPTGLYILPSVFSFFFSFFIDFSENNYLSIHQTDFCNLFAE